MGNVPAHGYVFGARERELMHAAVEKGWLTAGIENARFEDALASFTGIRHVRTCNSGSSANLLAVAAMVEAGYWKAGDEIITVAAGFPTTVNPLLLYGLVPVFVDIALPTYQVNVEHLVRAVDRHRTKGIMLAHTLGNTFDMRAVAELAHRYGLSVVEDCCDALGSTYNGQHVGTMGAIATCSFYPAHHITTGEGGAVFTQDPGLARVIESVRDWGRDCWCEPGANNTCGKRFDQQFGDLPYGYDHKYTFTRLGFNLKLGEIAASCGLAQIERLAGFVSARRRHFDLLTERLRVLADRIILPEATPGSEPSWFGFPVTLREEGLRNGLQKYLAQNGVDSRLLFGGNLTQQPYMKGRKYLVASTLDVTNKVMNDGLWIGVWPGLSEEQLDYAAHHVATFLGDFA
jgi:CDP-6-deoxy-D-xylo-4-hexulose-3-dehydrase